MRRVCPILAVSLLACAGSALPRAGATDEPPVSPLPEQVSEPRENPSTPEKVELGRQLFFDPHLSGDNTMSCATCHLPEKGFADALPRAKGNGGKRLARNTPSLLNVGFQTSFFWDGRAATLEEQALGPIEHPDEMHQNLDELERELRADESYAQAFRRVFGTPPDRKSIARALAAFERTLVTRNSPFDRFLAGDKSALSESAQRGYELFLGAADCVRCHNGPLLADGKFYRLGASFKDKGREAITGKPEDRNKFRTPSLRDVARTAPYMHDGSRRTLAEVVEFYYRLAPVEAPDGAELEIRPLLGRSYSEISDLVAFLESLSGELPKVEVPK